MKSAVLKLIVFLLFHLISLKCTSQYFGGISSGFNSIASLNASLSLTDTLFNGGIGNGFFLTINPSSNLGIIDGLYNGGEDDGSSFAYLNVSLAIQDSLYNGGLGKGENVVSVRGIKLSICNNINLVWNGNDNIFWTNKNNWDCGTPPTPISIVEIPSGILRYPTVFSNVSIKSLHLSPNASLTLAPLIGRLNVTGP
jgi:hypothetical protein